MQPVRYRIAEILKEHGAATVSQLAQQLGMAQVSVRHHLDILVGEDLVELVGVRRHDGAGRPSQVYALTSNAARLFPQRHGALASDMLAELKASLSGAELRGILLRLAERAAAAAPPEPAGQTIAQRLDQVTRFLTERGYNARWEVRDGRYELHACNCPYTGVADDHPELCMMDQAMIQQLLPGAVRVQSRVLDGSAHCTYEMNLVGLATDEAGDPNASP